MNAFPRENALEFPAVSKLYGERAVLDRLDLAIPSGSVVGLLGKNGAGKTTLLRCALGLAQPQHGTVTILGEPAWTLSASAKQYLGYVPQTPQLYPWMRVAASARLHRLVLPALERRLVRQLAADWRLPLNQRAGTLSVGEAQKLTLVMALGHEPDLLILDEPVASLDPSARREFLKVVLEIAAGGHRTRAVLDAHHVGPGARGRSGGDSAERQDQLLRRAGRT